VQSGRERMAGYWLGLRGAGIEPDEALALATAQSPDAGADAIAALTGLPARRRPTALIIANHEAGYGALPALRERSVAVPAELSVVCYEDSPLARWWHPAVTVIDNNARQMGELAAQLLLKRLVPDDRAGGEEFSEFRVGARLVERDSCRALSTTRPLLVVDADGS
jgi:LacI family transcriptional regulator